MSETDSFQKPNDILDQTLELLGDAYFTWDPAAKKIVFSDKLFQKIGYQPNEFTPSSAALEGIIHPNDLKKVKGMIDDLLSKRTQIIEEEFKLKDSSGLYKLFSGRAAIIEMADTGGLCIVGTLSDIGQQVKTQEELLQSERRLKRAQEIAKIGSWQEAPDVANNYWSAQTFRIFGFKKGAVDPSLRSIFSGLKKSDAAIFNSMLNWSRISDDLEKKIFEVYYKCPDGQEKFLLFIAEPVISAKGHLLFWQGIVQDVSVHKAYEKKLSEDKDNLMALVTNMPALVFATDQNGNLVFWNRTCEQLTGFKQSELLNNKDAFKLLFPETELRRKIRNYMKDMSISLSSWEQPLATKKGEKLDIVWSVFSQYVKVEGWHSVAIGYDITHRKKTEQIQQAYRRKLEALAETATGFVGMPSSENIFHYLGTQLEKHAHNEIFMLLSLDNVEEFFTIEGFYGINAKVWERIITILSWNPVGRRLHITPEMLSAFRRGKVMLISRSLYEFSGGIVSAASARRIERLIALDGIHTMGLQKDGKVLGGLVLFATHSNPEPDFSLIEGLIHQAAMAQDRRLVEEQLLTSKEKAEESDRLKSAFLANMSHEIRTPMNAILGFSQLLSIPDLTPEKKNEYIGIIHAKGNTLVKLINDIIDASKVEAGQLTLSYSLFKVNDLLKQLKNFYEKEKLFQQRENLDIKLTLPKRSNNVKIHSDIGRIEQVLTNLIDNALKFTEKGFVEFGYILDDTAIKFFVFDSGIGIDSSKQELIFDHFRQVERDDARAKGGTGLGLSISKGIIELLGGNIWVESSLGKGAKFFFTLPFSIVKEGLADEDITEGVVPEKPFPDWKNLVLLVAEDEEVNYMHLREILEPTGVNLLWAKDGAQAVDLVYNIKTIDAILMDIKMPVMNGYAATMEIRQINPNIPIVAQTAYAFTEDKQKAVAAGCDEYIVKPINHRELFDKLDRFMKRRPTDE